MHLQHSDDLRANLLVLDASTNDAARLRALAHHGRIVPCRTLRRAEEALRGTRVDAIVTVARLPDGTAVDVCRLAQARLPAPVVVVAGAAATDVADLIATGCDAILLDPVEPSLLCNRLRFVLRVHGEPVPRPPDAARLSRGTNQYCTGVTCARCAHEGAYRFDFTSRRRGMFACTLCRHTWVGERRERF